MRSFKGSPVWAARGRRRSSMARSSRRACATAPPRCAQRRTPQVASASRTTARLTTPESGRSTIGSRCDHGRVPKKQAIATPVTGTEPAPAQSLRALIERLHPAVLDVAAAPRGLEIDVSDPVIVDPAEQVAVPAGGIALAVGVDGERARVGLL